MLTNLEYFPEKSMRVWDTISLIESYLLFRTLFTALVAWCFVRFKRTFAHANSVARIASPPMIKGIPGPGRNMKRIPRISNVKPTVEATIQRRG
jgi:hypothetical protein